MPWYGRYAVLALLTAVFGELYIYPFKSELKLSAGVAALSVIILIMDDLSATALSFLCGLTIFIVRSIISIFFYGNSLTQAVKINIPSMLYYIVFGLLYKVLNVGKRKDNIFNTVLLLTFLDITSNIFEAYIRAGVTLPIIRVIIFTGFVRSSTAYAIYLVYNRQKLFILNREHQIRYTQLNLLVSNIQAEIFYLKKSMKDIEKVMKDSYNLHELYKSDSYIREKTLDIAREVHEIKKDYHRVLKGFENFVKSLDNEDYMTISNIFTIIRDNIIRYLAESGKNIIITFKPGSDIAVKNYYSIFTILNNIIVNSIDACSDGDSIRVIFRDMSDDIYFEVSDSGEGIEDDIIPLIFNPGFTTKYDPVTGESSTGIGLSHVKNIIEDLKGDISVESRIGIGTVFKIRLPKNRLQHN